MYSPSQSFCSQTPAESSFQLGVSGSAGALPWNVVDGMMAPLPLTSLVFQTFFFTKKTISLDICLLPDLLKCVLLWESGICSEQSGGENDLLLAMDMAKVAGPLSVVKSTPYCL